MPWPTKAEKPYADTSVNSAEPPATSMCVRRPAAFSSSSRSRPIAPPSSAATASRSSVSSQPSENSGTHDLPRADLLLADSHDARCRELEQLIQLVACERVALGGRLHLDEP